MRLFEFNLGIYDLRATSSICIQILSALQFSCETQTRRSHSSIPFIKIHVSVPARKEASVSPPLDKLQVTLIRRDDKTWHHIPVNPLITLIFTRTWKTLSATSCSIAENWQNIHRLAAETSPLNSWSWGIYIAWRASSGCRLRQFQGKGENQRCCQFCNILPTILDPVAENLASTFHVAKNSILVHPTRESAHLHGCMERRKASHPT